MKFKIELRELMISTVSFRSPEIRAPFKSPSSLSIMSLNDIPPSPIKVGRYTCGREKATMERILNGTLV